MNKNQAGHIAPAENKTYNERLFKKGIRRFFHEARYIWLQRVLKRMNLKGASILELGCYDGKLLSYLPFQPALYIGYDANWENGLDLAQEKWTQKPGIEFRYCNDINQFNPGAKAYDISVCMETLEHLPLDQLDSYLQKLGDATRDYIFITIPNEKGPLVALKYSIKKLFLKVDEPYSLKELYHASGGNLSRVTRLEYGHKGFDYEELVTKLKPDFHIISIEPIPFSFLPAWMNFSIGIIAEPKS